MNIDFNRLVSLLFPYLTIFTLALLLSKVIFVQLPIKSVEFFNNSNDTIEYTKYDFNNAFVLKDQQKTILDTPIPIKNQYLLNENINLQAIYILDENDSFAVITERSNNNTITISKGENFKGYKLSAIYPKYVLFEKNGKFYKLNMQKDKNNDSIDKVVNVPQFTDKHEINTIDQAPQIIQKNINSFILKKNEVLSYSKDLKRIWNDIGIKTSRKDGKIIGFKVYKIKKDSVFEELGLKKEDILTQANGVVLNNYQNAFKIYNMMNKTDILKLSILRDGKEMEIEYEIK